MTDTPPTIEERLKNLGFKIVPDYRAHKSTQLILTESEYRKLTKTVESLLTAFLRSIELPEKFTIQADTDREGMIYEGGYNRAINEAHQAVQKKIVEVDNG